MNWLKRMNSVLDYIENNLDGEIDENKIAMLSAISKGLFQRIFAIITDMTLSEYIRKRRLTQSAFDVQNTDAKIIDIAVKYGYNSANAFSSAFKNFHGITPSDAKKTNVKLQSFQRFTFTLTLSVKGGNNMQYHIHENAEKFLQKMVNKEHPQKSLQTVSEHNGTKCACDGNRAAVILPEGKADWDLSDAYFDNDDNTKGLELSRVFSERNDGNFNFQISKKQAAGFLGYFNDLDLKEGSNELIGINVNTMEVIEPKAIYELKDKPDERIIAFNKRYLKDALDFIVCSDDEYIEIYYQGNHNSLNMKSARLYALVMPVKLRN
jgi:AraC family transcriptional regulator